MVIFLFFFLFFFSQLLEHVVINNQNGRLEECFQDILGFCCHKWSPNGRCLALSFSLLWIIFLKEERGREKERKPVMNVNVTVFQMLLVDSRAPCWPRPPM